MRDYGKVSPHFWIGRTGKELRQAGPESQLVALYLLTSPHANMIGLYYMPLAFLSHETGLTIEGAKKGLNSAIKAGFCKYDEHSEMVWVIEMATHQIGDALKPGDKRCAGVQNEYDKVSDNLFLSEFYDKYSAQFNMTSRRESEVSIPVQNEGASKGLVSQEQEQEQEKEQDQNTLSDSNRTSNVSDNESEEPPAHENHDSGSGETPGMQAVVTRSTSHSKIFFGLPVFEKTQKLNLALRFAPSIGTGKNPRADHLMSSPGCWLMISDYG
jgi:hypothetical protein